MGFLKSLLYTGLFAAGVDAYLRVKVSQIDVQPNTLLQNYKNKERIQQSIWDTFETKVTLPKGSLQNLKNMGSLPDQLYYDFLNSPLISIQRNIVSLLKYKKRELFNESQPFKVGEKCKNLNWEIIGKKNDEILVRWCEKPGVIEGVMNLQVVPNQDNDTVRVRMGAGMWGSASNNNVLMLVHDVYARLVTYTTAWRFKQYLLEKSKK